MKAVREAVKNCVGKMTDYWPVMFKFKHAQAIHI